MGMLTRFNVKVDGDGCYDLHKLERAQYLHFRNAFVEKRLYWPGKEFIDEKRAFSMDLLLNVICMAMCGKIPEEMHILESVKSKVKLVPSDDDGKHLGALIFLSQSKAYNTRP